MLVKVGPVYAATIAEGAPVMALFWTCVQQPREPRERNGQPPTVGQVDRQVVVVA